MPVRIQGVWSHSVSQKDLFQVRYFEGKALGVVASKDLLMGDYVVEYTGELINMEEAEKRDEKYAADANVGSYMYYFDHNKKKYW